MRFRPCFQLPFSFSHKHPPVRTPTPSQSHQLPPSIWISHQCPFRTCFEAPQLLSLPLSLPLLRISHQRHLPMSTLTLALSIPTKCQLNSCLSCHLTQTEKQAVNSVESAIMPQVWNYFFHFETGTEGATEDIVIERVADYKNIVLTKHRNGREWRIWLTKLCKSIQLTQERRSTYLRTVKIFIEVSEKTGQNAVDPWNLGMLSDMCVPKTLLQTIFSRC